jgi:hypothetical protein
LLAWPLTILLEAGTTVTPLDPDCKILQCNLRLRPMEVNAAAVSSHLNLAP